MFESQNQNIKTKRFSSNIMGKETENVTVQNHKINHMSQTTPGVTSTSGQDQKHHYIVGESFAFIICGLMFYGIFPVSIVNKGRFYGRPSTLLLVWSAFSFITVIFVMTTYTLNRGFGISWPLNVFASLNSTLIVFTTNDNPESASQLPPFFVWVTMLLQILIPNTSIISGFLGLIHVNSFAKFLNRWSEFLKQADNIFSPYYHVNFDDMVKYRNKCMIWFTIPFLIFSLIALPVITAGNILQVDQGNKIFNHFFAATWFFSLLAVRMFCNVRDFLSFAVFNFALRELRRGMQAQYECLQDKITHKHVHEWLQLVVFIREQKGLLEKHIGPQNLWMLCETFVLIVLVLTAAFIAAIHEIRNFSGVVVSFVGVSFMTIIVLYRKANRAEAMNEEEDLLAESVVEMTASDDCETRLKMKSLCDLIFHDPIKITLGRVTVLNTKLILSFCTQIAAILVILLQFVNH